MSEEIKSQLEKIGSAWEHSKKAQDELDAKLEKGLGGIAEIKAKQEKIDADLDSALQLKESFEKVETTVGRMASAMEEKEAAQPEVDTKSLNSAMKKWLKSGLPEDISRVNLDEKEAKAMQSNIDPQGGYSVMPFVGGLEKIMFDSSPVRQFATVGSIGSNEYVGYHDDDENAAGWIGETSSRAETDTADLGEFRIPVREMYARFKISERLLEDSEFNLEAWAAEKVGEKFGRVEATAFVSGSSALQPQGLVTGTAKTSNADVYTRGQIGTKVTAGATAITSDELEDTRALLKSPYLGNSYFFMNRATRSYIRKIKDGQGNYLWQPSYQMGVPDELLGQRVAIFEDMADIATGAISVAFGDLRSAYRIVDRTGLSVLRDPYSSASTGQILFHMRKRVGGGIQNWDSLKYLKQA